MKLGLFGLLFLLVFWQQDAIPAVIGAANIEHLQSIMQIDFASMESDRIENGWFALSRDGERMAVISRNEHLIVWNAAGDLLDNYFILGADGLAATALDATFNPDGHVLVSAHTDGGAHYTAFRGIGADVTEYYRFPTADVPLRVWANDFTWLEISPIDYLKTRFVLQINPTIMNRLRVNEELSDAELFELPSGPENDADAFLRIGRIAPPLAVTVTQEGLVKRWNLESGLVTATAEVDVMPGAGQITPDGRYFAWRDGESANLHVLDFETGEDRIVVALDGAYIPFLLLTPDADVVIGVDVGLKPVVVAWDTATGERIDLGEYRVCNRQPDMVRLSHDGTTLVVGCDTGLDIWRIEE